MFYKTALYIACEKCNVEMVKLLLNRKDIDVNDKSILYLIIFMSFLIIIF